MKINIKDKKWLILNIIIAIAWIISFFTNYFSLQNEYNSYLNLYDDLMANAHYHNSLLQWENGNNSTQNSDEIPLFDNAKSAVINAWNNFQNASSYEINVESEGTGTGNLYGIEYSAKLLLQNKLVRWDKNTYFVELQRYQPEPIPMVGSPLTRTDSYYCINNQRWETYTTNLTYNNGKITSNYDKKYVKNSTKNDFSYVDYVINEKTIAKETFFRVNYNVYTGKIESYSASVILNNSTATRNMAINMKNENDMMNEVPIINYTKFNCLIGVDGNFITLGIQDSYTFSATYAGLTATVTVVGDADFNFLSLNKEPTMDKLW